ncbi:MAG TPA: DUF58 domain-containing protein [Armatimonadota bacterium]|nr:DUF58 domain-containing protein [Armatimonadota bacterium]
MVVLTQLGRLVGLFALAFFLIGFVHSSLYMYMIALFCLAALVAGGVFAWLATRDLRCRRALPGAVTFSGDPLESRLHIIERRRRWRILDIFDHLINLTTGLERHRKMSVLMEGSQPRALISGAREPLQPTLDGAREVVVRDALRFPRRGLYRLGPLTVHAYDPLGLVYLPSTLPGQHEVIVYPQPIPFPELMLGGAGGRQTMEVRPVGRAGESADFHGIRPYVQGDDLRRVHWKATAHTGKLAIKEYEYRHSGAVQVILDLQAGVYLGEGEYASLETAITLAASILDHVLQAGNQAGLFATGGNVTTLPPESGQRQRHRALEALALAKDDGPTGIAKALTSGAIPLSRRCTTIVITPTVDTSVVGALLALRGRAAQVMLVLLDARTYHEVEQEANKPKNPLLALATAPITLSGLTGANGVRRSLPTSAEHRALLHAAAAAGIDVLPVSAHAPLHHVLHAMRMRM